MFKGSLFKICLQAALMSTILTIIVLMCFYFISTMNQHKHTYDEIEIVEPTCTVGGFTRHICSCGETYVDSNTAPLGHTFDPETGICTVCQAECKHKWNKGVCRVCGMECAHEYGAGEHGEDEHGGYTAYVCDKCGYVLKDYDED